MKDQKYIIYILTFCLVVSFSYLIMIEKKQHQISDGWFVYFEKSTDNSSTFIIENYSTDKKFSWEASINNELIQGGDAEVLKNSKESVILDEITEGKSIKIKVFHSKKSKEIYKNFE